MSSLVLELQRDAITPTVPVSELLRKALVVARKLNIADMRLWLESELNGYNGELPTPDYRHVTGRVMGFNRFRGWEVCTIQDAWMADLLSRMPADQSVSELESLIQNGSDAAFGYFLFYPERAVRLIQRTYDFQMALNVDRAQLHGIVEAVRNLILEWSLQLEADGVLGEGMTFSAEEKQMAAQEKYEIGTFIGSMTGSQLQQHTTGSSQTMTVEGIPGEAVASLLASLQEVTTDSRLSDQGRAELVAEVATVNAQLESPKPKSSIIVECLRSARTILEGAAANGVANAAAQPDKLMLVLHQLRALIPGL